MRLALATVLVALSFPAAAIEPAEALANAVDGYIRPGFIQLAAAAGGLETAAAQLCVAPSDAALENVRTRFAAVVLAHARVEFLRFGPLTEDDRLERLLFWPDRKGVALRQVQAILATEDEGATSLPALRDKSVAVQGLTALEYALFGDGAETLTGEPRNFRCLYAKTIAEALAATSGELSNAWSAPHGIAEHLAYPKAENTDYRSVRESLEQLVGALSHGIEAIRDTRLSPFVGRDGEKPKPKSALFWRSRMTIPAIRAGFEGMRDFLAASEIMEATDEDGRWVENTTNFEFGNALRAAGLIKSPVADALADPKQKQALDYVVIVTGSLQALVGESLPQALGLSVGFSSLDGD